jgi:hypothetical protein
VTVQEDEKLKACCHALLAGCLLPILAFNIGAGNTKNIAIYGALLGFEGYQIAEHVRAAQKM